MSEQQHEAAADLSSVESLLEDLSKALTTPEPVHHTEETAQIIAKGADAIILQNEQMVETVCKGLHDILDRLERVEDALTAIPDIHDNILKGLSDIKNAPLPSKAVTAEAEEAPAEVQEDAPVVTKDEVLSKALNQLQTAEGDRKVQLLRAVAHLDSNFNPASVAADFNL